MNAYKLIRAAGKLGVIIIVGAVDLAVICGGLAIGFLVDETGFVITAIALLGSIAAVAGYHRHNEEQIAARQRHPGVRAVARVPAPPQLKPEPPVNTRHEPSDEFFSLVGDATRWPHNRPPLHRPSPRPEAAQ